MGLEMLLNYEKFSNLSTVLYESLNERLKGYLINSILEEMQNSNS